MAATRPVILAAITGAHGVAGEVRLKIFGVEPGFITAHKSFNQGAFTLTSVRDDGKGGAIARFAEVPDRTAAEKLRGTTLSVSRDALPPLGEGEYYHIDLIGLAAMSSDGTSLGEVIAVHNFGAGDVLEIRKTDGKTFMVPMRVEAVPEWDDTRLLIDADWTE